MALFIRPQVLMGNKRGVFTLFDYTGYKGAYARQTVQVCLAIIEFGIL
jgi:hypothetical protein